MDAVTRKLDGSNTLSARNIAPVPSMILPHSDSSRTTMSINDTCSSPKIPVALEDSAPANAWKSLHNINGHTSPPFMVEDNVIHGVDGDGVTTKTEVIASGEDSAEEASANFWHQIGLASACDGGGHHREGISGYTSIPKESSGISDFQLQVARVVDYVVTENIKHEMSAKAILADLIAEQSQQQKPVSQEYLQKVSGLVESYKALEKYVANMTSALAKLATEVDEKNYACSRQRRSALQSSAVVLLPRELDGANRSSAFLVVLSDIYEVVRSATARQSKLGGETPSSSKWVAPSSFERATSKYW